MPETPASLNPFPGLRTFQTEEEYLFFGRETQRKELIALLAENRFISVLGASGSGKSSLVRAGLLPALCGGFMTRAGSNWNIAVLRPGGNPIGNLVEALLDTDPFLPDEEADAEETKLNLEATLLRSGLGVIEAARQVRMVKNENLLIVVDQFEELFRFSQNQSEHSSRDEATAFVNLLLEAAKQTEFPIYVVLTMRSDFFGDCAQFEDLADAINKGEYLVPRMNRDQRTSAIVGPVKVGGAVISNRLLQRLLNDVGEDPDHLPVMQHALMRTWRHWEKSGDRNRPLDLEDYQAVGRMETALSNHADEVFSSLSPEHRIVCRNVFQALTLKGNDNRGIRRPTSLENLASITGTSIKELQSVINDFRGSGRTFLMPPEEVELQPDTVIDISHESLMRVWQRLGHWVEEEAQSVRIYRRLAETAQLHQEGKAGLYRDPDLQIAASWRETESPNEAWACRYDPSFGKAMEFLENSKKARDDELEAIERSIQRELEQSRAYAKQQERSTARLRKLTWALSLVFILAVGAFLRSTWLVVETNEARTRAENNEVDANRLRDLARVAQRESEQGIYYANIRLADSYIQQDRIVEARKALMACPEEYRHWEWGHLLYQSHQEMHSFVVGDNEGLNPVFGPKGKFLVIGSPNFIQVWDLTTSKQIHTIETQASNWNSFTFHPKLPRFLLTHPDGTGSMVEAATGLPLFTLEIPGDEIVSADTAFIHRPFSPDGSKFVTYNREENRAAVWDAQTGRLLRILDGPKGSIKVPFYTSDGTRLISRSFQFRSDYSNIVLVWDVKTENDPFSVTPPSESFRNFDIHPNGELTVTLNEQGAIKVWEAKTGSLVRTLHHGGSSDADMIRRISFEANGILEGRSQNSRIIWDIHEGRILEKPPEVKYPSRPPFVKNHRFGVYVTGQNTARIWDPYKGETLNTLRGHFSVILKSTISPDGRLVATAARNGVVKVWLTQPQGIRIEGSDWFLAGDYSPDGQFVAAAQFDRLASVWETATGKLKMVYRGHMQKIEDLHYSPDGQRIVTCAVDKTAQVWDAETAETLLILRGHSETVQSAVFSPDGKTIATGSNDGTAKLWNAESGLEIYSLSSDGGSVYNVAFSPEGTILATSGQDNLVKLWEVETGLELATLKGHTKSVHGLAFSSDGSLLASSGGDTTIRIWDVPSGKTIRVLQGRTGVLDLRFSLDDQRLFSVSSEGNTSIGYPSLDIWDVKTGRELLSLRGHSTITQDLAYNAVNRRIGTFGLDRTIHQWITFPWNLNDYPGLKEDPPESRIQHYARTYWTEQWNLEIPEPELDLQQISEQLSDYRHPRSRWPQRNLDTPTELLDLAPHYNGLLNVTTIPPRLTGYYGDDLSELPQGEVFLNDVRFDIRGVIQLASHQNDYRKMYPESVNGISVNLRGSRFHFLHGTHLPSNSDPVIGSYIFHYEDGSRYERDIQMDRDVRFWNNWHDISTVRTLNSAIAWRGFHNHEVRYLYYLTVENPHPDLTISHLDFVSKMSSSAPFLVAVTVQSPEDSEPLIHTQPQYLSVHPGDSASFQAGATSKHPLSYQWLFNGEKIAGATGSVLTLNSAGSEHAGEYSVLIQPDSSESVLAVTSEKAALTVTDGTHRFGIVKAEWFDGIEGPTLEQLTNHIRFPDQPDRVSFLSELATPLGSGENYGLKISGVLFPPKTGDYTFYLNSDDAGGFYLSRNEDPSDLRLVAADPTYSSPLYWLSTFYQRTEKKHISQPIALNAGEPYYFEALLKERDGPDFLGVTWKLPGGPEPTNGTPPISGKHLAFPISE